MTALCVGCNQTADQLEEYVSLAKEEDMDPSDWVSANEGTYNRENGHFLCTECYINAGMPSSPMGWKAP